MTTGAGIWNFELIGFFRRYEIERVTANVHISNCLFNQRHMAGNALRSWAVRCVMRMLFNRCRARTIGGSRIVACQTDLPDRFNQIGVIGCAMNIVAAEAGHTPAVHQALDKVIALHPVLVSVAICEVGESRLTEFVIFQFPIIF